MRLLGPFGLQVVGEERGASVPARARMLLAYLVLHAGTPHDRQRLAFMLWPDSTEGQARTNLRNIVHHLRRAVPELEPFLDVAPGHLRWIVAPSCRVDVTEFVTAVAAADRAAAGEAERVEALRAAVAAYGGDLLEGTYGVWLDDERARLRDRYLVALRDLTAALTTSDPSEAVRVGRGLVRRDPLSEEHHRLLIAACMAAGDRAGAVRAYHECVEVLGQELGVEPSAATLDAYQRLVEDAASPQPARPAGPAPPAATTPLVGRADELAELLRCWAGAARGHPQLVLVRGEPGVGKTRLVEALASECARHGAVVAKARSYLTEGELGYSVVTEWLRTPPVAVTLRRAAVADRVELARLLPELADGAGELTGPVDEGDRLRLFEAVARALTAVSRPLLLVADDAHWCDAASLQLLHYLVRSAAAPVLVAVTARREALDEQHPLTAVVRGLQVLDRATTVDLDRLTAEETVQLAGALGARGLDADAGAHLYRETEGNPLFIVEALRAGWDGRSETVDLSPKLHAVIAARLAQLSENARTVLGVAATAGRAFTAGLIAHASGLDELALVRGLDELWQRGVVEGHEPDGYDFTHGKIREAASAALSPAVRARHHARIADALVATSSDVAPASGSIAAHFDQAGRVGEAVHWYQQAAAHAVRLGAHADAIRILDRARELVVRLPEAEALPAELELLGLLPPALSGDDGYASDRLSAVQQRAADVAANLGVELEPPMLRSLVMSSLCRDEFDEADAAARRLHAAGVAAGDEGLALESTYLLGVIAFWSGRLETAAGCFQEVVEHFDPQRHPDHVVRFGQDPRPVCLSRLANTMWFRGRPDDAAAARDEALAMLDDRSGFVTPEVVHIFGAILSLDLDDHDAYRRCAAHFADGRERAGAHLLVAESILGYVDVLDGSADRGIRRIDTSIERCEGRNPAPSVQAIMLRLLVSAHAAAGDPAGGLIAAGRALALGGTRLWEPEVRRLRARFLASLGAAAPKVTAELDQAATAARELAAPGPAARVEATRLELSLA